MGSTGCAATDVQIMMDDLEDQHNAAAAALWAPAALIADENSNEAAAPPPPAVLAVPVAAPPPVVVAVADEGLDELRQKLKRKADERALKQAEVEVLDLEVEAIEEEVAAKEADLEKEGKRRRRKAALDAANAKVNQLRA